MGTIAEEDTLSEILRLLNERFDYDFNEDDEAFVEHLEENIAGSEAMRRSAEVNPPGEARLTFEEVAMIGTNSDLYREIVDNGDFATMLFDQYLERQAPRGRNELRRGLRVGDRGKPTYSLS